MTTDAGQSSLFRLDIQDDHTLHKNGFSSKYKNLKPNEERKHQDLSRKTRWFENYYKGSTVAILWQRNEPSRTLGICLTFSTAF